MQAPSALLQAHAPSPAPQQRADNDSNVQAPATNRHLKTPPPPATTRRRAARAANMADGRARAAVQQCRDSLADLQRSCDAAKAHKQACSSLLAAASDAVEALDALAAAAASDAARGRSLQQLAVRCQGALDQVRAGGFCVGAGSGAKLGAGRGWPPTHRREYRRP